MTNVDQMSCDSEPTPISKIVESIRSKSASKNSVTVYRYEIFKGRRDDSGVVHKVKPVGSAYIREGLRTYTVAIKTFLLDKFYLLPNTRPEISDADYVILTREPGHNVGRKYFWNNVGEGRLMDGPNHGLLKLTWDILPCEIYMNLNPVNVSELAEAAKAEEAA